ncbi:pilus assembly protein PilM [Myxococcota bacterium]|nr:pilus assembly protein PilM [Myxococcota bacterium]
MAQRILGLDIGKASIKAVVLQQTGRQYNVEAYHLEAIPLDDGPETEAESIQNARKQAIAQTLQTIGPVEQIITSLPGSIGASAVIDLPFSDTAKIEQVLSFQLDEMSPFEIEDLIYDYQFIESTKEGSRVLVGNAPIEEVGSYLRSLQEAAVDPRVLMLDGLPYTHLFPDCEPGPDEETWGVLDLGFRHTTLTLFRRYPQDPKEPVRAELVRSIQRGTRQLRQALITTHQIHPHQAHETLWNQIDLAAPPGAIDSPETQSVQRAFTPILTELRRSFAALQRRASQQLQTLYITGGGAMLRGIATFLAQRLNLRVLPLQPKHIPTAEGLAWPQQDAPLHKALALALRGLSRSRFAQINFRTREFAYKGDLQFLKDRIPSLVIGSAILLVLLMTSVFTGFYALSKENTQLQREVERRCQQILGQPISDPTRCINIMLEEIQKAKGTGEQAVIPTISAYDMFLEIYDRVSRLAKDKKLKIEITRLNINARNFELEGETDSYAAASQIQQNLKEYKCFAKMPEGVVQRAAGKQNKYEFRLRSPLDC